MRLETCYIRQPLIGTPGSRCGGRVSSSSSTTPSTPPPRSPSNLNPHTPNPEPPTLKDTTPHPRGDTTPTGWSLSDANLTVFTLHPYPPHPNPLTLKSYTPPKPLNPQPPTLNFGSSTFSRKQVFTFEAAIAETDERVKLWVLPLYTLSACSLHTLYTLSLNSPRTLF